MNKINSILILFAIIISSSFSQQVQLNSEPQTISAGAEYSIYLQNLINSGLDAGLKFNGSVPAYTNPTGIEAITTIEGINFDEDAANSGFYHIPPDPHGAAGPNHLVSVVNTSIEWFTKAGVQQNSQSLASFFSSLTPLTGTFDPKVIYDQYDGRFVVVTLERTTSPTNTSRILVAVSQTSDPNGGWYFTSINSALTIGTLSWADYPGFAVSNTGLYITANMFSFSTGSFTGGRLWIIDKGLVGGFYAGGVATSIVQDHITLGSGYNTTYQPAHMFGTAQTGVGIFLVAYGGLSGGGIEYLHVIQVSNSLSTPTFTGQLVSLGDIDNTAGIFNNAPQLGTSTLINTNDRRSLNSVWRNNSLWMTACVVPPSGTDAGQVTAHWCKVNTTTLASLVLSDQGNIGGETIATGCYTFFPSIAVNNNDEVCVGFSASASTIYPGCYYTGRSSTDPAGTTIPPDVVRAGLDYYVRTFGSGRNRWGDYSGTSVDPSTQSFYLFNQYSLARGTIFGGEDGRWGTVFGLVPVGSLPVELTSFSAITISKDIKLSWNTATEVNNYGFEIERMSNVRGQTSDTWEKIGFVEGSGNSNSPKDYSFLDDNVNAGKYSYRLKQIDNDGQFEYSKTVEVDMNGVKKYELTQNYPNPFNPTTTISYILPQAGMVRLTLYNILGQEIRTLVNEVKEAGTHTFNFDASDLNSGMYIYKIESGSFTQTRKMTLVK